MLDLNKNSLDLVIAGQTHATVDIRETSGNNAFYVSTDGVQTLEPELDLDMLYQKCFRDCEEIYIKSFPTSAEYKELVLTLNGNMVEYSLWTQAGLF